jgi:hypothetical protein
MIHVAGASWLRFGKSNLMEQHLLDQVEHYGRSFGDVGLPDNDLGHKYRHINEAQVRLSIWSLKENNISVTLVEMMNFVDYQMSFWRESKFKPLPKNLQQLPTIALSNDVGLFLLRNDFISPPSPVQLQ